MNYGFSRAITVIALATLLAGPIRALQQQAPAPPDKSQPPKAREFSEPDALGILQRIGDALESHNEARFLCEFDPAKMPDYAVFRDQVQAFFEEYESFQVSYHLQQVAKQGEDGVALADFTLDGRSAGGQKPDMRKEMQLRLVLAWNGKAWSIIDLSPREVFGGS